MIVLPLGILANYYLGSNNPITMVLIGGGLYGAVIAILGLTATTHSFSTKQQVEVFNIDRMFLLRFRYTKFFIKFIMFAIMFFVAIGLASDPVMITEEAENVVTDNAMFIPMYALLLSYPVFRVFGELYSKVDFEKGVSRARFIELKIGDKRSAIANLIMFLLVMLTIFLCFKSNVLSNLTCALAGIHSFICVKYTYDKVDKTV